MAGVGEDCSLDGVWFDAGAGELLGEGAAALGGVVGVFCERSVVLIGVLGGGEQEGGVGLAAAGARVLRLGLWGVEGVRFTALGEGSGIVGVDSVAVVDLGADPVAGEGDVGVEVTPGGGGLPCAPDVLGSCLLPPLAVVDSCELGAGAGAFGIESGVQLPGGVLALGLGVVELLLALAYACFGDATAGGHREADRVVERFGDAVWLVNGHVSAPIVGGRLGV